MEQNKNITPITPEVGKRYVTRGGWITPPIQMQPTPFFADRGYKKHGEDVNVYWDVDGNGWGTDGILDDYDLISEYVEPTAPDTFRRDLIARIYCHVMGSSTYNIQSEEESAVYAIKCADTLIKAMEASND